MKKNEKVLNILFLPEALCFKTDVISIQNLSKKKMLSIFLKKKKRS